MNAKRNIPRRQIFVLTPDEKRTVAFVMCALVLGIATKHYRETHPQPVRPMTVEEQRAAKKASRSHHVSSLPKPTTAPANSSR